MSYQDASGSYEWIIEDMPSNVELTDEQISRWIAEITEMVIEQQTIQIEAEAETKQYPVQMWTNDVIANDTEEYITLKLEALREELAQERQGLFQYLRDFCAAPTQNDDIEVAGEVARKALSDIVKSLQKRFLDQIVEVNDRRYRVKIIDSGGWKAYSFDENRYCDMPIEALASADEAQAIKEHATTLRSAVRAVAYRLRHI